MCLLFSLVSFLFICIILSKPPFVSKLHVNFKVSVVVFILYEYYIYPGCNITMLLISLKFTVSIGMVWYGMVWKVQPSKASSCCSRGMIDEVIRESRSPQHVTHLPHVWDLLLAQNRHWYKGPPI